MVLIFADLEIHFQRRWLFRPRQRDGMTVDDYYAEFCNWKEEMINVSFPAKEEDYIDGFIENLKWDVRWRSSKYESSRIGLKMAFHNAKFEESMMQLEAHYYTPVAVKQTAESDSIVAEEICVDDARSAVYEKGSELASGNHSNLRSETTDGKHSDEEFEVNELLDCAEMLDFKGIQSNDSTDSEVVSAIEEYEVSASVINSHSSVNSSHQKLLNPMDSGFKVLSIYCAHMASKWNTILEMRPKQSNDMSVEVYYDLFYSWKKKLDDVNYIGGEESYIDDFIFGLELKLGMRVYGYKWKPQTLYGAFRRAELEESIMNNGANTVLEEMPQLNSSDIQDAENVSDEYGNVVPDASLGSEVNNEPIQLLLQKYVGHIEGNVVDGDVVLSLFDLQAALGSLGETIMNGSSNGLSKACLEGARLIIEVVLGQNAMKKDAGIMVKEMPPTFRADAMNEHLRALYIRGITQLTLFDPGGKNCVVSMSSRINYPLITKAPETFIDGLQGVGGLLMFIFDPGINPLPLTGCAPLKSSEMPSSLAIAMWFAKVMPCFNLDCCLLLCNGCAVDQGDCCLDTIIVVLWDKALLHNLSVWTASLCGVIVLIGHIFSKNVEFEKWHIHLVVENCCRLFDPGGAMEKNEYELLLPVRTKANNSNELSVSIKLTINKISGLCNHNIRFLMLVALGHNISVLFLDGVLWVHMIDFPSMSKLEFNLQVYHPFDHGDVIGLKACTGCVCVCLADWGVAKACKPQMQTLIEHVSWVEEALNKDDVGLPSDIKVLLEMLIDGTKIVGMVTWHRKLHGHKLIFLAGSNLLNNFVWDPGQDVISLYIIEDNDVLKRNEIRIQLALALKQDDISNEACAHYYAHTGLLACSLVDWRILLLLNTSSKFRIRKSNKLKEILVTCRSVGLNCEVIVDAMRFKMFDADSELNIVVHNLTNKDTSLEIMLDVMGMFIFDPGISSLFDGMFQSFHENQLDEQVHGEIVRSFQEDQSLFVVVYSSFWMIEGFTLISYLGHLYIGETIVVIQILWRESCSISSGLILFILTLKKKMYKYQFGQYAWTHMKSSFTAANNFEGIFRFILRASPIVINDTSTDLWKNSFNQVITQEDLRRLHWSISFNYCVLIEPYKIVKFWASFQSLLKQHGDSSYMALVFVVGCHTYVCDPSDAARHFTTLRTRWFSRGWSCHELRSKIRNSTEGASVIVKYLLLAVAFSCDVIALFYNFVYSDLLSNCYGLYKLGINNEKDHE